jgi:hypothetical protein
LPPRHSRGAASSSITLAQLRRGATLRDASQRRAELAAGRKARHDVAKHAARLVPIGQQRAAALDAGHILRRASWQLSRRASTPTGQRQQRP